MSLTLTNPNTNQTIEVPIDNQQDTIPARAFEAIRLAPTTAAAASSSDSVPLRLYDPGFKNTTVCKTSISLVDGQQGKLFYRGYDVEELVEKSNFLEVAYLLIYGELPTRKEFDQWNYNVLHHTYIHTELERQMLTFRYDAHPMGMLISTIASLSTFHPEANPALQGEGLYALPKPSSRDQDGETGAAAAATQEQQNSWDNRNRHIFRMLGKVATIAANTYRHRIGRPYNHPMPNCNQYCENMLYMMDKLNEPNYVPNDKMVEILDKLFIVLAEHGSNCSTMTMRHLISSGVDPYTALSGSLAALFGERKCHAVIEMLSSQIGSIENIPVFLNMVKRKQTDLSPLYAASEMESAFRRNVSVKNGVAGKPVRLMGFGHRIYKTHDPRVKIAKNLAMQLMDITGRDKIFDLALALEEAALNDEYFTSRKLFPNIDYWTAVIFNTLRFPKDMFAVWLAVPRVAGFLAHWIESIDDPEFKIYRPRQIYYGPAHLPYHARETRSSSSSSMEYDRGDPTAAKRRDTAEDSLNTIDELIAQTEASMKELDIMVNNNSSSSSNATASSDGASEENSSTLSWIKSTIFGINQTKQLSEHLKKTQQELLKMLDQQRQLIAQQQQQQPSSSPSPRTFI